MAGLYARLLATLAALSLVIVGCTQAAPAPAPTAAPPAPAKSAEPAKPPAEPTKAPAAQPAAPAPQPTSAPATKVSWPEKGRPITFIISWTAGGSTDVGGRLLAPLMEKELGTTIQVVNRVGAGGQVGIAEIHNSKPDGYTFGFVNLPSIITMYLDAERKTGFKRETFQPLAMHVVDPALIAVKADSPYKTMKDLVDAAKANPEKIKACTTGVMTDDHLVILQLEKLTDAKFAAVHFDGGAPAMTAVLGGHVDVYVGNVGDAVTQFKSGQIRVLGIGDREESKFYPGVKTFEAQGYKLVSSSSRGLAYPLGVSKEIVDTMSGSIKIAMADPGHRQKMEESALTLRYMDPAQFAAYWQEFEEQVKPLMALAR